MDTGNSRAGGRHERRREPSGDPRRIWRRLASFPRALAVARETREETAWRFTSEAFLGAYLWKHPGSGRASLRFAFIGSVTDHDASQPLDHGILRTHWLTRLQVVEHGARLRSPLVLRCIDDYLAGQRQPLLSVGHLDLDGARAVPAVEVA